MASSACKWTKCLYDLFVSGDANITIDIDEAALALEIANAIDLALSDNLESAYQDSELEPNPGVLDQRLTVSNVSVQFAGLDVDTDRVFWRLEGGSVRVTFDGSAPSAGNFASGNGHILRNNDSGIWSRQTAVSANFIRNTGTNGYIHLSEFVLV